jgi:hypothetical protein
VISQVLEDGEFLVEAGILKNDADAAAHFVSFLADVMAEDGGGSTGGHKRCGQDLEKRCLAPAVGAKQPEDFASKDLESYTVERPARGSFSLGRILMD